MEAMMAASLETEQDGPLLLDLLEAETQEAQARVEGTLFMQELFRGSWGQGVFGRYVRTGHYVTYLQQLLRIYLELERAWGGIPDWRELWRSPAIEHDLVTLGGRGAVAPVPLATATQVYLDRLRELKREAPYLLTAHAYVRCSLDVLEGPVRQQRLSAAFGLPPGLGASLYRAVPTEGMGRYRELLEHRLETRRRSGRETFELIEEARTGFRLNGLLFDELARGALGLRHVG